MPAADLGPGGREKRGAFRVPNAAMLTSVIKRLSAAVAPGGPAAQVSAAKPVTDLGLGSMGVVS
ncbi:hypothetical protein TSOC_008929, partial [Tetrabaena socialis]